MPTGIPCAIERLRATPLRGRARDASRVVVVLRRLELRITLPNGQVLEDVLPATIQAEATIQGKAQFK